MVSVLLPVVRYLIACEDIRYDVDRRAVTLVNLIGSITSLDQPPFPLLYPELAFSCNWLSVVVLLGLQFAS